MVNRSASDSPSHGERFKEIRLFLDQNRREPSVKEMPSQPMAAVEGLRSSAVRMASEVAAVENSVWNSAGNCRATL